jgi:predicted GIY-YIG superfamily endonuclease
VRTALYRIYAVADDLLYIGISKRFGARWDQHAAAQPWWSAVCRQTVEWPGP